MDGLFTTRSKLRIDSVLWPVSLSLGLHLAIIALVLGRSGWGGRIAPPHPAVGPIVVDIVSLGSGESGTPGDRHPHVRETVSTVSKSPAMPAHKSRTVQERIASPTVNIPVPSPPLPSHENDGTSMAGEDAPPVEPAESSSDDADDRGPAYQTGPTGPQQPMFAYVAGLPGPGLTGRFSSDGPGVDFIRAEAIDLPEPVYPDWCRRRGQEGKVILSVRIGSDGRLGAVSVVRSSGFSMLDRSAVTALQKARFSPASEAGILVSSTRKIAYSFRMTDARY